VVPILVVLASLGVYHFLKTKSLAKVKIPAVATFFVLMLLPLVHQAKTFPVDYVYFNAVSGGNKSAWSNYEYDYYFHSMKEVTDYLVDEIGDDEAVVAMNCQLPNYFEKISNQKFQYTRYLERSSQDWDYAVFGINYIHPYQLKNNTWQSSEIIKTFYHKGNPLAVVLKRTDKTDFSGIEAAKQGNWDEGEKLMQEALKSDPNNIWLFVNLANLKLAQRDYAEVDNYLERGRAIQPYYEPLYLIEAQKLYDQQKYAGSMKVLDELIKVNPRYKNAAS
jgi:tetratricopeptide (TPR) repeat protein